VRVEPKVQAATGGATAAAAVCWVLTQFVFHGALPVPVEGLVDVVVPGAVALLGGYAARHVDRPPAGSALPNSPDPTQQAAAGRQYIQDTYGAAPVAITLQGNAGPLAATIAQHIRTGNLRLHSTTPVPARPPLAVQQPSTTNPEEKPMSLVDEFRTLVEQLRGDVVSKVGGEVADDIHAAIDLFKGQGAKLLIEAGHDAQADATTVAGDVAQVATDTAGAVAPAPASAPVEGTPVEASTDPAAPTA
jgi:hypothetical protein